MRLNWSRADRNEMGLPSFIWQTLLYPVAEMIGRETVCIPADGCDARKRERLLLSDETRYTLTIVDERTGCNRQFNELRDSQRN